MDNELLLELRGDVDQIIFRNESNGYTVLNIMSQGVCVTAVGNMPCVNVGQSMILVGKWKTHNEFGLQFSVDRYKVSMPTTDDAIIKYLSSGIIKGIGEATANKLVDEFGKSVLQVIEKNPEKLCKVSGITELRAQKISKEFSGLVNVGKIMDQLREYGILPEEVTRIYRELGEQSIDKIKDNPYVLCIDGIDIEFDKADIIAQSLEKPGDDMCRIRSGLLHILKYNLGNGHTCLPKDRLIITASEFLGVNQNLVQEGLQELINEKSLILDNMKGVFFVFLPDMYDAEAYCAMRLMMMLRYPPNTINNAGKQIEMIEMGQGISYADLQKKAIIEALSKGLLVLTGGPGTGKTTTLKAIIEILIKNGEKVILAAPTGRAARRMSEITGRESKTIHRLLEAAWSLDGKQIFNRNERNMLQCDSLIIDELSMVDIKLFESVLRALPMGCRLIMVGDSDQLPSVGAGDVVNGLTVSKSVPVVKLTEIFRQAQKSLIVTNAHKIVKGKVPDLKSKSSDFFFMHIYDSFELQNTIVDLCKRRLPARYGYSPASDIQVITPGRKGTAGTIELNNKLQEAINPSGPGKKEIVVNQVVLREKDKVMQMKNDYDIYWEKPDGTSGQGVYNGDVGEILEIDNGSSVVVVKYDDKIAVYDFESIFYLDLAYAITVHKSQGSEFEAVVMPVFGNNPKLYYRNLLYTAITRAKSIMIIVGSEKSVFNMVENDRKVKRYSGMSEFILRGGV